MIKALLNGILSACSQLVNLVTILPDTIIKTAFPDLSNNIQTAISSINSLLLNIAYALGFLPTTLITILIVIFTIHITFIGVNKSVNAITRLYKIIQKIKFW